MRHITKKTATARLRTDLRLPATHENADRATAAFYDIWLEAIEESNVWGDDWMPPIGRICVGACNFAAAVGHVLFGGTIIASYEHTWLEVRKPDGVYVIDLSGYDDVSPQEACDAHATFLAGRYNVEQIPGEKGETHYELRSNNGTQSIYVGALYPGSMFERNYRLMRSQDWLSALESVVDRANGWAERIFDAIE